MISSSSSDTGEGYYSEEYILTIDHYYCDYQDIFVDLHTNLLFKEMIDGWLKPHKQLRPYKNHIVNHNLKRNRFREKKQIFLLKQAS